MKTVILKHASDNRYDAEYACTHDMRRMKAIATETLGNVNVSPFNVVGVDEAQWFEGLGPFADSLADQGKIVVIAALSSDFRRAAFPEVASLLPLAEKIDMLTAVCRTCGNEASFSFRKSGQTDVQLIGGQELYEACCRSCYKKLQSNVTAEGTQMSYSTRATIESIRARLEKVEADRRETQEYERAAAIKRQNPNALSN